MTAARDLTTDPIRWGVVGPGGIARRVMHDLVTVVDGGVLCAVGSRSADRAKAFATDLAADSVDGREIAAYGSYRDVIADPEVEVIYIATPHRQHEAIALEAIAAGKHLLVEKAFTCTLAGARRVVDAARDRGVFVMEAMWTRFQPTVLRMLELIEDGAIGEVRSVRADLGLHVPFDPTHRLWDLSQGGGALLDLGVYPVSFAQLVLGRQEPEFTAVASTVVRGPNGADCESSLLLTARGEQHAVASCSLLTRLPGDAAVFGTDGWIELPPRFHHPQSLVLHRRVGDGEAEPVVEHHPSLGGGYAHELIEVQNGIRDGLTESPRMPLRDTLAVMAVLEQALVDAGIHFTEGVFPA